MRDLYSRNKNLDEASELTDIAMILVAREVLEQKISGAENLFAKRKPKSHSTPSPSVSGALLQIEVGISFHA